MSYDKERAATGEVRRHAPPETPFLVFLACVAGVWKKWAQERMMSPRVSLSHARSFLHPLLPSHTEPTAPVLKSNDSSKL